MPSVESVSVVAQDGHPIAATRYSCDGPPKAIVVVAGATATPRAFYRRFAERLCEVGYTAITFDYRGVGGSAPASLIGYKADFLDWGQLDLAAVLNAFTQSDRAIFVVGHSFGGHALGLLPANCRVDGLYTFGTGAGWPGWMPLLERLRVRTLWGVVTPFLTRWKGYLPFKRMGMGEDLPLGVYRQWKRWCRFPRYFFEDPLAQPHLEGFSRVKTHILAANAMDDKWAMPSSRDAFMQGYTNAQVDTLDILPAEYGLKRIGHMGYFREEAQCLWTHVHQWLDSRARDFALGAKGQ